MAKVKQYGFLPPELISADPTGTAAATYDRQVRHLLNRFVSVVGDGTTTVFPIKHRLNSQDAIANVYATSPPYGEPAYTVQHTDENITTITFTSAPTTGQYRVVIRA